MRTVGALGASSRMAQSPGTAETGLKLKEKQRQAQKPSLPTQACEKDREAGVYFLARFWQG